MKRTKQRPMWFYVLKIGFCVSGAAWLFYRRLSNPDMTETRLMLTFWPEWFAFITGVVAILILEFWLIPSKANSGETSTQQGATARE